VNQSSDSSWTALRVIAGLVALLLTAFVLLVLRHQILSGRDLLGLIIGTSVGTAAVMCWWFALQGQHAGSRAKMTFSLMGGLIVGGIGFAGGFFGPMIFSPQSNQGPLLGIFFTGPIGFMVGIVLGTVVGFVKGSSGKTEGIEN
jgi:hypothetical protein